jgi:hypothetical protein
MRTPKESTREKSQKNVVAKPRKTGKLKVVDVELKSKRKLKAGSAKPAARVIARKRTIAKDGVRTLKRGRKPESRKALPAAAADKTRLSKAVKPLVKEQPQPAEMITIPTEKLLRPFRRAAELNRQQAKKLQRARAQKGSFLAKPVKKGKRYLLDLRVHSPGTVGYFANGGIEPGPALTRLASVKGLHMIGLAEYYDAAYVDQVRRALPADSELVILPGVVLCCELASCRDVPLLVLFPQTFDSAAVLRFLDALGVPPAMRGRKDYCLPMDFGKILEIIDRQGGIAIPSRVDKTPYRQLAIPELVEHYGLHAFDLAHPDSPDLFRDRWPSGGFTFFSFSSANALGQIGNRVGKVSLATLDFEGLRDIVKRRDPSDEQSAVA